MAVDRLGLGTQLREVPRLPEMDGTCSREKKTPDANRFRVKLKPLHRAEAQTASGPPEVKPSRFIQTTA